MHLANGNRSWTWELRPPRVLLAEEDSAERGMLAGALRADGYDVLEASSADEVLDTVLAYPAAGDCCVDVVVASEALPCCAGQELVTQLRQMAIHTPCVLLHHPGRVANLGTTAPQYRIDPADVELLKGAVFQLTHDF